MSSLPPATVKVVLFFASLGVLALMVLVVMTIHDRRKHLGYLRSTGDIQDPDTQKVKKTKQAKRSKDLDGMTRSTTEAVSVGVERDVIVESHEPPGVSEPEPVVAPQLPSPEPKSRAFSVKPPPRMTTDGALGIAPWPEEKR